MSSPFKTIVGESHTTSIRTPQPQSLPQKQPRKHAALIKAWADGAEIQYKDFTGGWVDVGVISWYADCEYRIKPEPKPDVVQEFWCELGNKGHWHLPYLTSPANLRLTFDGETGKLKKAEVLNESL